MRIRMLIATCVALGGIAIGLAGPAASGAAGREIDIDQLKAGDKLEVEVLGKWIPAEFERKVSERLIHVKRQDLKATAVTTIDRVRRPTADGVPAPATPADNPFATPEEKQAASQVSRTWSDSSGEFKVEAVLERVDGTNIVLRREDGKEVKVPISQLSNKDQAYLAATASSLPRKKDDVPRPPKIDIKVTDVQAATQASVQPDAAWTYQPRAPAPGSKLAPVQIALRKSNFFEHPMRILFLPQDKKAFVVSSQTLFGSGTLYRVQACDLARRQVGASGVFAVDMAPLDISTDGKLVVARTEAHGFGGSSELQLFALDGNKVKPIAAWLPFRHHASPFANSPHRKEPEDPSRPELGSEANVSFAQFLDAHHLLTAGGGGEVAVWKLPEIEPVYYMPSANLGHGIFSKPAITSDKAHLALVTQEGIALVRTKDGQTVGFLPTERIFAAGCQLAWSEDGKKLALHQFGRIRVWDLTNRELWRDFAIDRAYSMTGCNWADENHLLFFGGKLVDVERRIPAGTTGANNFQEVIVSGLAWSLHSGGRAGFSIQGTPAMPKDFKDPAPGMTAEQLLVIRPGIEVQLELPPGLAADGSDPRAAVIERLKKNGAKVVSKSNIRLVGTLTAGETKTVKYETFRRDKTMEATVTVQILKLNYLVDGETVWKHESHLGAPGMVHMEKDETIDQAIGRVRKTSGMSFANVWIPAYVAQVPAEKEAATVAGN